jgi:hypothetical protein
MDQINSVCLKATTTNSKVSVILKCFTYFSSLVSSTGNRVRSVMADWIRKWNEQAARAVEIERMRTMDRMRMNERFWWVERRWFL